MDFTQILQLRAAKLISRAAAYLLLNISLLPQALATRVTNKEVELFDGEVIHTFSAASTATGNVLVLTNSSTQAVGVSDFRNGELVSDRAICFDRVELHYAGSSASDISKTGTYTPHVYAIDGTARIPGNVLNGVLRVYVNGKVVVEKQVGELMSLGREYQGVNVAEELAIPKVIPPGVPVKIELELPPGNTVGGANTHYFMLKFKGVVTAIQPGK